MNIMKHAQTHQNGSVILEAMIAILVFSIGILSLVGMQATAISTVADSKYRSTAGFLADQMVGAIWANREVANTSNSITAIPDTGFCTPLPCGGTATPNATALAAAWVTNVQTALPQPTAGPIAPTVIICNAVSLPACPVVDVTRVVITVRWQAPKDPTPHHHTVLTYIN